MRACTHFCILYVRLIHSYYTLYGTVKDFNFDNLETLFFDLLIADPRLCLVLRARVRLRHRFSCLMHPDF